VSRNQKGQGLVEYLILVCLVAVSAIAVVSVVGTNVREQYANISAALSNKREVKLTQPERKAYQVRGMDDFMESSRTHGGGPR
jgi:Flp pilus assembly pilin Flp